MTRLLAPLRHLPRTVWLVGLISLCNDAASDMIYPLIPLYLASVLMAGPRALGLIEGIAEATASLLKLFSGILVDRSRHSKPWVVAGYALASAGRPLIALAQAWPWVLLIRFTDRIGKGLRTSPRDALLAASIEPARRGLAFGLHRAMDNAGAVVGPLLAAALLAGGMPMRDIFLWAALPGAITLLLAISLQEPVTTQPAPPVMAMEWSLREFSPPFRHYLLSVALFTLGNSSNLFLLLRARELGVTPAHIPLLWAGVSLVAALFSTPLSALSDRIGRQRLIIGGWGCYALFYAVMGFCQLNTTSLFVLFACYGLFMAATEGVEKALVADLAPTGLTGTAYGWFNLTAGILLLPASLIFGALYETCGPTTAFGFSAGCAALAAAWAFGKVFRPTWQPG